MKNIDGTLRQRGGPILETIVRLTLGEQSDVTLEQISLPTPTAIFNWS